MTGRFLWIGPAAALMAAKMAADVAVNTAMAATAAAAIASFRMVMVFLHPFDA